MSFEGKDFLTRHEAAQYACVSIRHWDNIRNIYGIQPIVWAGKLIFRKADIARAIDECQRSKNEAILGCSVGAFAAANSAVRSGKSRRLKRTSS